VKHFVYRPASGLALLCLAGCVDLTSNDDRITTIWNAELAAEPEYPDFTGLAAALSGPRGTEATILLQGAEPGAVHTWALRLGSCTSPGQQIGPDTDYPELVAEGGGEATEDALLGPMLSRDNTYHVEARATAPDSARVVCGDLVPEGAP
jgi:hypothetical protein